MLPNYKLLSSLYLIGLISCKEPKEVPRPELQPRQVQEHNRSPKDTLSIVAVGDMMIGSGFPSKMLPPDDAQKTFDAVKSHLKGDIVFGNLEGCFLDSGESDKCKGNTNNTCYAFRMPKRYGKIFKQAGFNLLSIANNHVGDFGNLGRRSTVNVLNQQGIHYAGQIEKPYEIFQKEGITYGFCAFAPNRNTVSINDIDEAKRLVTQVKSKVDILIVSFHGGAEGSNHTKVPRENEIYFGENRGDVYAFSHAVIDAGADLVLGHGPHVLRGVEVYKGRFIAYSLGNFNTYGGFSLNGANGFAAILDIKITPKGEFLYAKSTSTKQTRAEGLTLDPHRQGFAALHHLSKKDLPNNRLKFKSNQTIGY